VSEALELVYEVDGLPAFPLPPELASRYGGTLGFASPRLIANFVETLDGVVAVPSLPRSNRLIAAASEADRFVMGLLRACCDAVVIGAGTLSGSPRSLWTPERAFPAAAAGFAELRRALGYGHDPELVVLTASGLIDPEHPALAAGALVLTTDLGAERLSDRVPPATRLRSLGAGQLDLGAAAACLAELGHRRVLSEGGPHTIGPLLAAGLVDELFITLSPLVLGRNPAGEPRLALVEGTDLLAAGGPAPARLLGVRRNGDHLFLRYALGAPEPTPGQ
jgi:riboflavin biosynthesis pyrimidine reductase